MLPISGEKNGASVRCERVDALLEKLKKKEQKLKKKLANESSKSKQKELTMELRIIPLELKKRRQAAQGTKEQM